MGHLATSQNRRRPSGMLWGWRVCLMARWTVYPSPVAVATQKATSTPPRSMAAPSAHHIQLNMVVTKAPRAIQRWVKDRSRQSMGQNSVAHGRRCTVGGRDVDGLDTTGRTPSVFLRFLSRNFSLKTLVP